ncbi:MAG: ROK family protein [Calditrichaeota bacterium]|nr:ROK family protein [Calditrichota bacterium]
MNRDYVIGIDIGGTNTQFGIVDRQGNCAAKGSISTAKNDTIETFLDHLHEEISRVITESQQQFNIVGIGIGAPNGNYFNGTIENAPNLKWKGIIPVVDIFKQFYKLPIVLTNDANAAAIGEAVYGGAKGMANFVVVTLGTGLGSGFVINDKLLYGHDGFAGELGHTIVDYQGRPCGCGRLGCLETYVSATGIKRTVIEMLKSGDYQSTLSGIPETELDSRIIADAAKAGDKLACDAFEFTGKILGRRLADTVAFCSPEAIFLFGGLSNAGQLIFEPTYRHMEANMLNIFKDKVKLLPSKLEAENAAVLGAAALIWRDMEQIQSRA